MDRLYKFAEKAIKTAGEVGAEKRKERRLSDIRAETGRETRHRMTEAGRETRHKREYGAPSIGDPGGFRYAELAARKSAGTRLSAANQAASRKRQLEDYDIKTEALFSPHVQYGSEGEAMLPSQLRNIYNVGKAMSLDDPEGAQKYIKTEIAAYAKSATQETRMKDLGGLSKEQLLAYEQSLTGGGQAGGMQKKGGGLPIVSKSLPGTRESLYNVQRNVFGSGLSGQKSYAGLGADWLERRGKDYLKRPSGDVGGAYGRMGRLLSGSM